MALHYIDCQMHCKKETSDLSSRSASHAFPGLSQRERFGMMEGDENKDSAFLGSGVFARGVLVAEFLA